MKIASARERRQREEVEHADVEVGETMSRPHGNTASIAMPGMNTIGGSGEDQRRRASFGCSTSFWISLIASATGCSSPNGPTRFGPRRTCMRPTTRRSTQMLMIATAPTNERMPSAPSSADDDVDQPVRRRRRRESVVDRAAQVREVADVPPVVRDDGQQRSIIGRSPRR